MNYNNLTLNSNTFKSILQKSVGGGGGYDI